MKLQYHDCTYAKALSKETCKKIINIGLSKTLEKALIDDSEFSKLRKSDIAWLEEPWIYEKLMPYVEQANQLAGWNFEYSDIDGIQFTKYGIGQHYNWHKDSEISFNGDYKIRKISISVNLNNEYEGGEFYIDTGNEYGKKLPIEIKDLKKIGTICVFPSDIWHKVDKITKGIRYSLVIWVKGNPWK